MTQSPRFTLPYDPPAKDSKSAKRPEGWNLDTDAAQAGALQNQRSLVFSSREAMERFLKAAQGKGIAVLGSIDKLNALHVGFLSLDDLTALLDGSEESGYIFPVTLPTPQKDGVQDGAIGFGNQLLAWLGISGDNSAYGTGVKVGGASLKSGSPTVIGMVRMAVRPTGSSAFFPSVTSNVTDAWPR